MLNFKNLIFIDLHLFEDNINISTSPLFPDEKQTYFEKRLIDLAEPELIHDQFAVKRDIPKNHGDKINFRKFHALPKATTPLTEGVTPDGQPLAESHVEATLYQYGGYVMLSDRVTDETIDDIVSQANKLIASQAGRTLDTITREILAGTTSVQLAPEIIDGEEYPVAGHAEITENCRLTSDLVMMAATELAAVNAPTFDGCYVAIVHPYAVYELMKDPLWIDINKYNHAVKLFDRELGKLGKIRFVENTEAKIIGPDNIYGNFCRLYVRDAVTDSYTVKVGEVLCESEITFTTPVPVYLNGTEYTITKLTPGAGDTTVTFGTTITAAEGDLICGKGAGADGTAIYNTMVVANEAYAVTTLAGEGMQLIVKPHGSAGSSDPLNQRGTSGWKARKAVCRLVEEYMICIKSAGKFSKSAVSN